MKSESVKFQNISAKAIAKAGRFLAPVQEFLAQQSIYSQRTVSRQSTLVGATRITIGKNVRIHPYVTINCQSDPFLGWPHLGHSEIVIGDNTTICSYAMILSYGGKVIIGENCSINPFSIVYGHGGVSIGKNTRIACHSVIIPANHIFQNPDVAICKQGLSRKGIEIGSDVWIGANSTILDGVKIPDGCVVAAQSVVTKSHPEYSVLAGVPAKAIQNRRSLNAEKS